MTTTKNYDLLNRLLSISSVAGSTPVSSHAYQYNDANQRTRVTQTDGSFWVYEYDKLGQVISGKRYWSDGTPVAGQQHEYTFDDIGNRTAAKMGGDATGQNLRSANYGASSLNQYTNRTVPSYLNIMGIANPSATVSVNDLATTRKGEFYRAEPTVNNAAGLQYPSVTNKAVLSGTTNTSIGSLYVPKTPETFAYDADGNMTNDGRWVYVWDGENRLLEMQSHVNALSGSKRKIVYTYDHQSRLISRKAYNGSTGSYVLFQDTKWIYDGWRQLAEVSATNSTLIKAFTWGVDLSGSLEGAGGIGGLLMFADTATSTTHFYAYDGNGNVMALANASDGTRTSDYEYGPFGEVLRASGTASRSNPFRFSTKCQDDETDLNYYGYRFYHPALGRWPNRDPIGEAGGVNLYCMVGNSPVTRFDSHGLVEWGDVIPGWWDAVWNLFDWATGHSGSTDYGPDSLQSRQMSQSSIAGQLRDAFLEKNRGKLCKDWKGISNVRTQFRVSHEVIVDGFNGTAEFVGRATGAVIAKKDLVECKILAEFNLMNTTSLRSLLYGRWPESWNVTLPGFPFANWTQFYTWNESFYCDCCLR